MSDFNSSRNNQSKQKLLQITHDLAIGGLQHVVLNLCKNMNRELFDVSVLCLRGKGELSEEIEKLGIKVFTIPTRTGSNLFAFRYVMSILRRENIDIIHTHNSEPFVDGTIAALFSKVKTIVHTEHGREFPDKWRYMFEERILSTLAYKVVGVSEDTSQNLIKYFKISPHKITTINNGIDLLKYKNTVNSLKKKTELSIENKSPIIGIAARLTAVKGISYLIKAMPTVIRHFPDVTLVIAGEGLIKAQLIEEVHSLKLDHNVKFLGSRMDMPEILNLLDIFVLPSISEGLPMVLLEAMAAGCPIIASKVGGIPSVITHGENGSLVRPRSVDSLAGEIITLLSNENLMEKYKKYGIKKVEKDYSAAGMTRMYEKLYLRENNF
jgi:glycosyltransferase involved in cell wall biosynthesis